MRAYSTVQQLLCHGSYCELILSLARTSCRLLFTARPAACPLAGNPLRDAVRSRNPSKSTQAHDAVTTAVLHKHHPIIRVGAGLIQFVYRSHLRLATEATRNRNVFSPFFARVKIRFTHSNSWTAIAGQMHGSSHPAPLLTDIWHLPWWVGGAPPRKEGVRGASPRFFFDDFFVNFLKKFLGLERQNSWKYGI